MGVDDKEFFPLLLYLHYILIHLIAAKPLLSEHPRTMLYKKAIFDAKCHYINVELGSDKLRMEFLFVYA